MDINKFTQAPEKIIHQLLCKRFETLAHQSLVSFL
jgi:hypothetical protein